MMQQGRQGFTETEGRRTGRVRIYEVAKEVGLPNNTLVAKVRRLGIDVKNHMSSIDVDDVQRIKRALEKERVQNREVKRISATVIRRRSKAAEVPVEVEAPIAEKVVPKEVVPSVVGASQMEVSEAAEPAIKSESLEAKAALSVETPVSDVVTDADFAPAKDKGDAASKESVTADAHVAEEKAETKPDTSESAKVPKVASDGEKQDAPATKPAVKAEPPKKPVREIRYAPGYGPNAQPPAPVYNRQADNRRTVASADPEPVSAAEAAKMMLAPSLGARTRPKVVITDLDNRSSEFGRKDLFQERRRPTRGRKKKVTSGKKGKKTEITMPAEHKRVIRVEDTITVAEVARQMGVKATEVLKRLWADGLTNVRITHSIDADTAGLLAGEFGYEVEDVAFKEEQVLKTVVDQPEDLLPRAPVVTVMGHVDHGKTSLLDAIRGADVASREAGGITQHMAAYRVATAKGELVFLDTPGHEAFTEMRARGAQCTDIVVLVVAADDGVMPQTAEAIDHARSANVPILVAVNKIDRAEANADRVKTQLAERNLVPEEWGGETLCVNVSAVTGEGIDDLLENLVLQSELLELRANPTKLAIGAVVEARMDKARGPMATVLVQEGTLKVGDIVVAGEHVGKVRALLNDRGTSVDLAGPSTPVEVLGLGGVPHAGDVLNAIEDDKAARQLAEHRHNQTRRKELGSASTRTTYEDILGQIQSGEIQELKTLIKADVQGSAEATKNSLEKLCTEKVGVNVISAGVGGIHETDVNLAKAAGAIIIGFNVRPAGKASQLAEREGVEIRTYDVIYELLDDVRALMRGLLPKERSEKNTGKLEVRQTFTIPKVGTIAGCAMVEGKVSRASHVRLIRDNVKIYDGKIDSLKRFKDDVREVVQGYECGLSIVGYKDIQVGDIVEAYDVEEITPELS